MNSPRKKPPRRGRPPLPKGEGRVVLQAQRVAPDTLRFLERTAPKTGGIGRVIDAAVIVLERAAQRCDESFGQHRKVTTLKKTK